LEKAEKAEKLAALKAEKAGKLAALKAEKAEKSAALKAEKAEKLAALKAEKAEKLAIDKALKKMPKGVNAKTELVKIEFGYFIGVDISSIYFDACINGKVLKFSQDAEGFALFLTCLSIRERASLWVVVEATGGYESKFCHYLVSHGIKVSVVNPYYLRSYAICKGIKAKTDDLDAKVISKYARMLHEEGDLILWKCPSTEQKTAETALNLADILASRIQEDKNRLNSLRLIFEPVDFAIKMLEQCIADNEKRLAEVENIIKNFTKAHQEEAKLLKSIPGIGKKTIPALLLLLCMNREFDSAKTVCSFIGLDPTVFTSGTTVNKNGKIRKKGYGRLRTLLYMCAVSAKKHNKACKQLYERLIQKGKAKKTALIAVANKLVKQVFAILNSKNEYKQDYQRPSKNITQTLSNIA
jgi:transposase